jgi:hypothetical protein
MYKARIIPKDLIKIEVGELDPAVAKHKNTLVEAFHWQPNPLTALTS